MSGGGGLAAEHLRAATGSHPLAPSVCLGPREGLAAAAPGRRFYEHLGREAARGDFARALRAWVQVAKAPLVGAQHVTCSDGAELEGSQTFHQEFVRYLVPPFALSRRAEFRTANLGGRYEWGTAPIAEIQFAGKTGAPWKLLLVKINAHVAVDDARGTLHCGKLRRFDADSPCCGALSFLLSGKAQGPFAEELREAFGAEELDRLALLRDPEVVDPALSPLYAAALDARLQARRAMIDAQEHVPRTPTLYLIVPCLSLNRRGSDAEIPLGVYYCDRRGGKPADEYCGLGDDPRRYTLAREGGRLVLSDPDLFLPRPARDHRGLIRAVWAEEAAGEPAGGEIGRRLRDVARRYDHRHLPNAKLALKAGLAVLCEAVPASAALLAFGQGLVHARHTSRAHRLAREAADDATARAMFHDIEARIDALDPERARHLMTLLLDTYAR
ncbi:MAG: hypothetical protein AB1726_05960 [Planctomycetota bacterium]